MKSLTRREVVGLLGLAALATVGCAPDNEGEAELARKSAGDPGKANPNSKTVAPPPVPKSQEEWMKNKGNAYQGTGYPGAKPEAKK